MIESFSLHALLRAPVVLYLRVSSDRQKETHTIETQRQALTAFCAREGIEITAVYTDDGVNGDLPFTSRPGASQMLADAKDGKFRTVLVYMYSRLSRDLYEGLVGARSLKQYGASPVSMTEMFDINTPFGEYMFAQSLSMAQFGKAQFLAHAAAGRYRSAERGVFVGGTLTYGYKLEGRKPNIRLVAAEDVPASPTQSQVDIVRWIFQSVADEGKSATWCATHLNALGVLSPDMASGRRKESKYGWLPSTITGIIHNQTYKGVATFGKRSVRPAEKREVKTAECAALVDAELWERANAALPKLQRFSQKNRIYNYLFTGLIKCGECGLSCVGYSREGKDGRTLTYYRCGGYIAQSSSKNLLPLCNSRSITSDELLDYVSREIEQLLANPAKYQAMIAEQEAAQDVVLADTGDTLRALHAALEEKEGERQIILTQLRKRRISDAQADTQFDQIEAEEETLRSRIKSIEQTDAIAAAKKIQAHNAGAYLAELQSRYSSQFPTEFADQREMITRLVKQIIIHTVGTGRDKEATAHVDYRFAPDNTEDTPGVAGVVDTGTF